jgi:hypothetical protein
VVMIPVPPKTVMNTEMVAGESGEITGSASDGPP